MKSSRWLKALAIILALFTIGHTLGTAVPRVTHGADQATVLETMRHFRFRMMSFDRSYFEVYRGFALSISVLLAVLALIAWQLGAVSERDPRRALPIAASLLAASVGLLVLARMFFFDGPIIASSLAVACATVAVVLLARETTAAGSANVR